MNASDARAAAATFGFAGAWRRTAAGREESDCRRDSSGTVHFEGEGLCAEHQNEARQNRATILRWHCVTRFLVNLEKARSGRGPACGKKQRNPKKG